MKVSELEGAFLDAWVARAMGYAIDGDPEDYGYTRWRTPENVILCYPFEPHRIWSHGGPIIERERITIKYSPGGSLTWEAYCLGQPWGFGTTPLIAAMRAYVASKYGVELPDG